MEPAAARTIVEPFVSPRGLTDNQLEEDMSIPKKLILVAALGGAAVLGGCATGPYYDSYGCGYGYDAGPGYGYYDPYYAPSVGFGFAYSDRDA